VPPAGKQGVLSTCFRDLLERFGFQSEKALAAILDTDELCCVDRLRDIQPVHKL
jgi:hypothetical protein